jgi:hypothetical protein
MPRAFRLSGIAGLERPAPRFRGVFSRVHVAYLAHVGDGVQLSAHQGSHFGSSTLSRDPRICAGVALVLGRSFRLCGTIKKTRFEFHRHYLT